MNSRWVQNTFIALGIGMALTWASPDARADLKKAEGIFEAGIKLFRAGKMAEAKAKFEASYAEEPAPRALFNIALTEEELKLFASARARFRMYAELPEGFKLTPQQREKALRHVQTLEAKVCTLKWSAPTGATVSVDGKAVRGEVFDLAAGLHTIEADTVEPKSQQWHCVEGELKSVVFSVPTDHRKGNTKSDGRGAANPGGPLAADADGGGLGKPMVADDESRSAAGYVIPTLLLAAGAAGISAGYLFADASNNAKNDVQGYQGSGVCAVRDNPSCLHYEQRRDDQSHNDTYAKIAYVGGGALMLTGLITLLVWPPGHHTVSVAASPNGAAVSGVF